jgi:hypothetical protein
VTDAVGRLIDFDLSAGQAGDIRFAIPLLSRLPAPDHQLADTGRASPHGFPACQLPTQ